MQVYCRQGPSRDADMIRSIFGRSRGNSLGAPGQFMGAPPSARRRKGVRRCISTPSTSPFGACWKSSPRAARRCARYRSKPATATCQVPKDRFRLLMIQSAFCQMARSKTGDGGLGDMYGPPRLSGCGQLYRISRNGPETANSKPCAGRNVFLSGSRLSKISLNASSVRVLMRSRHAGV